MTKLPEMTQGNGEPANSTSVMVMGIVSALSFMILYGVLYPSHPFPGLGEIIPLFSSLGNSLVWFLGMMIAMLIGEGIAE